MKTKSAFIIFVLLSFFSNHLFSQTASFILGIKNDWSFFTDRIIYANDHGIFYRLNNDTNLYYSDGTTAGTQKVGYFFGSDVFFSPDLSVFTHDENFTALGTNMPSHDIIIFKNKSTSFVYVEQTAGAFNGMTFYKGNLYYLFAKSGTKSNMLMEYNPNTKVKREVMTFDANGAYGISTLNDKLIVVGYKGGNKLLSVDPITGSFEAIYSFNATNTSASNVNMTQTGDKIYFWYPNGASPYTLFVTKGKENTTYPLVENLEKFDQFVYYRYNYIGVGDGKLIWRAQFKNDQSKYVYYSDGTVFGTKKLVYDEVKDMLPFEFTYFCGDFFFGANDEQNNRKLFRAQPSTGKAIKLSEADVSDIEKFNNRLYVSAEFNLVAEMYAWDDKQSKLVFALDINGQARDSEPREMRATKDKLFLTAKRSNTDTNYNLAVMTEATRTKEECLNSSIETEVNSKISVYPNPFNSRFIIGDKNINRSPKTCIVTDLQGKIIESFEKVNLPLEVNTIDWNAGMYFVKIQNSDGSFTKTNKFVKY